MFFRFLVPMLLVFSWALRGDFIGVNEFEELEVAKCIQVIDRTHSKAGRTLLEYLLVPLSDCARIESRQAVIKKLVTDDVAYNKFKQILEETVAYDVTSLFDASDLHSAESIGLAAPKLYYPAISLSDNGLTPQISFESSDALKESDLVLDSVFLIKQVNAIASLCGLIGLQYAFNSWIAECMSERDSHGSGLLGKPLRDQALFFYDAFGKGFKQPLHWICPLNIQFSADAPFSFGRLFSSVFAGGSWKDTLDIVSSGAQKVFPEFVPKLLVQSTVGASVATVVSYAKFLSYWETVRATLPIMKRSYRAVDTVRNRMIRVSKFLKSVKQMASLIESDIPELHVEVEKLLAWNKKCSKKCKELSDVLVCPTFKKEYSIIARAYKKVSGAVWLPPLQKEDAFLYSRGTVLRAAYLLQDIEKEIVTVYSSFALIDAYYSLATVYREFSGKQGLGFCFVDFVESEQPLIVAEKIWLPTLLSNSSLEKSDIVANDISLCENIVQKMIISGPNGTGKSMILKSIGIGTVLGQSVGIFPAQSCQMALFDGIKTSIAPDEDNAKGLSRFGAELLALEGIWQALYASSKQNKKMLVIIDEPCRGTHPEETSRRFCDFCKNIAGYKNLLLLCASHSPEVCTLELETGGSFINYHMFVKELSLGIFERTYQVEKGSALWWFGDPLMRSRYVDWFLHTIVKPKMS